jgi:hypothetical protein
VKKIRSNLKEPKWEHETLPPGKGRIAADHHAAPKGKRLIARSAYIKDRREVLMNLRKTWTVSATLFLAALGAALPAAQSQYAKYLSAADIELATGLKGVKQVPQSADADGDLNFARADGKLILSATFVPSSAYASAKSSEEGFKSTIKGVGEEAFVGPLGGPPLYILVFRKGAYAVILNTELEGTTRARLTIEQLTAIAKIIASRM